MRVRTALALIWLIYTSGWMMYQFIFGGVESNPIIATIEIILCAFFICLGIERLLRLKEK